MRELFCLLSLLAFFFTCPSRAETDVSDLSWQKRAGDNLPEILRWRTEALRQYPDEGQRIFDFLVGEGMPETDLQSLSADFLTSHLDYAMKAREEFPWAQQVPQDLFLSHVLPYAIVDETRELWRPQFAPLCREIVKDARSASEAAQLLNRDLFKELKVHYHTGRKKPNQSPSESMATGKATCTGLSIILAYGCRSVGIPARLVGTPLWSDQSGNHTWVEIWDGEWKFLGADEYDPQGLNRGWFTERAAQAQADQWQHAIWATSWKKVDGHFPMVWDLANKSVGARNVTSRYLPSPDEEQQEGAPQVGVRVFEKESGDRVIAEVALLADDGEILATVETKAGTHDLNDVARLPLIGKAPWRLRVRALGQEQMVTLATVPEQALDVTLPAEAAKEIDLPALVAAWQAEGREEREKELAEKVIRAAGKEMRFLEKKFGEEPENGHSLWISLHGGGGAPPEVNDRQWRNQIRLYQPAEGYYVAPRAPTDTWNLWHQAHIDPLFDRLIANYVSCRGVDPNRVYLLGYSAGGDGVYQLAPRMADRFAAAAMMAGHPNESQPDGLRNLPFEIFMGGQDRAFDRNQIAAKWGQLLAQKKEADPAGYPHRVTIYPELGHWMEGRDAEALPRMSLRSRVEWPRKVVWLQDDVTHQRFYWLGTREPKVGQKLIAEVKGQTLIVKGKGAGGLQFWLSDKLLDLDQEVVVQVNGKERFRGVVLRSEEVVQRSLRQRSGLVATALLEL